MEPPLRGHSGHRGHARSSTVNSPSCIVQRSPLKHTEHGGGAVQGGTKALGYKVTWLRMNTQACASFNLAHAYDAHFPELFCSHHPRLQGHGSVYDVGMLMHSQDCKSGSWLTRQLVVADKAADVNQRNFRFNAGSTLFPNRVLSAMITYGET